MRNEMEWKNTKDWIPGLGLAFSLANPTGYYYFGGTNEFLVRNVQLFYGLSLIKAATSLGAALQRNLYGLVPEQHQLCRPRNQ
jgi:hypothetical protein